MTETARARNASVFRLAAGVSRIQSALFVLIALTALALGIDRFVEDGFGALFFESPHLFRTLCLAFAAIAVLGLAITPAEERVVAAHSEGLAALGGSLARLGHMGTIAFFSWWLFAGGWDEPGPTGLSLANRVMPIQWGVMFELLFVGAWVWIMAWVVFRHGALSRGFGALSIAKATSFWFALLAFVLNERVLIVVGLGAVALVFGPWWHVWIARSFLRDVRDG